MKTKTEKYELTKTDVNNSWEKAKMIWKSLSIPYVISVRNREQIEQLGEIGQALIGQLAFMKYPEFQIYTNLEKISEVFLDNPQRGLDAVIEHEQGHKFCPYDSVTLIILNHLVKKSLSETKLKDDENAINAILNLYSDMCINTARVKQRSVDIPWAYQKLSIDRNDSFWKVYGKSMEFAWDKKILPEETKLD